jgi:hypothetical protein
MKKIEMSEIETLEITNITSDTKEGKGGADTVKKKERTIIKDSKGLIQIRPRMRTCWRVEVREYITPTSINRRGELIP